MTRKELKNKIGEYVETGIKLIGVGNKYAYYYSIWDDGTGKHSGYCRRLIDYGCSFEFIGKPKIKGL